MVCTYCGSETQVINSRHQKRANNVWRRRKCTSCQQVVTTIEQVDYEKSWVVQYPGKAFDKRLKPHPFLRDKLLMSIHKSLGHRGAAALPDALGLTGTVMARLQQAAINGELTSTAIATAVYDTLHRFDKVAATMYKAYHCDSL